MVSGFVVSSSGFYCILGSDLVDYIPDSSLGNVAASSDSHANGIVVDSIVFYLAVDDEM